MPERGHAIDLRTDHVGREQIGRELNAAELRIYQSSQRLDGKGLCKTGHTFKQHMAVAEKSNQQRVYQMLLAHYALIHTLADQIQEVAFGSDYIIEFADVDVVVHLVAALRFLCDF